MTAPRPVLIALGAAPIVIDATQVAQGVAEAIAADRAAVARRDAVAIVPEGAAREPLPEQWKEMARGACRIWSAEHPDASIAEKQRAFDRIQSRHQVLFELHELSASLADPLARFVVCPSCHGRGYKQGGQCALCAGAGRCYRTAATLWSRGWSWDPNACRQVDYSIDAGRLQKWIEDPGKLRDLFDRARASFEAALESPSRTPRRRKERGDER